MPTAAINGWSELALVSNPPPAPGGRRIKLRYVTLIRTRPPSFMAFGTRLDDLPASCDRTWSTGRGRRWGLGRFQCGWRCGARRTRSTRGEEAQEASGLRDPESFHARHDHNLFL